MLVLPFRFDACRLFLFLLVFRVGLRMDGDLTPVLGYSDDFVAITYALLQVQGYVDAEVKEKSKHFIEDIFGTDAVSELD